MPTKSLLQKGIALDPANSNIRLKDVVITKDELYDELARDWSYAEQCKDQVSAKRQVRVLEKAFTSPCFPDKMIPLRPKDASEIRYYMALLKAKDTLLFLTEVMYEDMKAKEEAEASK